MSRIVRRTPIRSELKQEQAKNTISEHHHYENLQNM